jgi:hypothetical protein
MAKQGVAPTVRAPAVLAASLPAEVAKWAEVVRVSGARVD